MHRTVVVTGAAGGIGLASCSRFAADGWRVIAVDREPVPERSGAERAELADLTDVAAIERVGRSIRGDGTPLAGLVNCAGVQLNASVADTAGADWDRVMAVNVRAAFLMVRETTPLLCDGSVVNVASVHAVATSHHIAAYAASKGALVALTRALAIELSGQRTRVNAVLPGAVDTDMLRAGLRRGHLGTGDGDEELLARLAACTPLARIATPDEIAEAILFLADADRSSFVTGQTLVVDGGALARLSTE